jgi:sugar phosphate isomerase/epimerase
MFCAGDVGVKLSVTTDYAKDTGDPAQYLRRIADMGFSYVHWGHHWNTDFLYSKWEIEEIQKWLTSYGLQLLDLHGSIGPEKNWASPREYERLAGVELVQNRVEMAAQLGGKVIVMHVPHESMNLPLRKSLEQLEPFVRTRGVRIAIENTNNFDAIAQLLSEYDANYLGLCYDSGHGNMSKTGLEHLEILKDSLISVHLHDNDGSSDQHMLPFSGTTDWRRLARIIAASAYTEPVSMEVSIRNAKIEDEEDFLKQAFEAGKCLSLMINETGNHTKAP